MSNHPPMPHDGGFVMPDEAAIRRQMDAAAHQGVARPSGPLPKYVKHLPPQGYDSWRSAPVNTESLTFLWLCPLFAPGRMLGFAYNSHFGNTRYARNGHRLACSGDDCEVCGLYQEMRSIKDPDTKERVQALRRRSEMLYNVVHWGRDDDHVVKDGQGNSIRKSAILSIGAKLDQTLMGILEVEGPQLCHPQHGRSLMYKKQKTGARMTEVSYSLMLAKPKSLPQQYWDLCRPQGMWDMEALYSPSNRADQVRFIEGLGFRAPQIAVPQQVGHAQPHQYDQQQVDPYGAPPDMGRQYSHPPQAQSAPPRHDYGPPPGDDYGPPGGHTDNPYGQPPEPPVPGGSGGWDAAAEFGEPPPGKYPDSPPPAPQAAAPAAAANYGAPPSVPPPSYGQAAAAPAGPPAPPSASYGVPPGPPEPPSAPASAAPPAGQVPRLHVPLPPNVKLPGDRERCFGHHNPQMRLCQECPPAIASQCKPQTPGYVPPQAQQSQAELQQMAQQMRGQ